MSKNLRSLLIVMSLAFMLLGGILTPYTAQARGEAPEQQTKSIIWKASRENAAQFQALAEEMGVRAKVTNVRQARRVQIPDGVQLSDRQVSADELAKLVRNNINHDNLQRLAIYIGIDIYIFGDGSVLVVITVMITP